jgi:sugar lactone lactonase YvrE
MIQKISTRLLLTVGLFCWGVMMACSAAVAQSSDEGFMITGLDHPESVAFDGTSYYISNVGKEMTPTAKDGDGYITRVSPDGTILDAKWVEGLHAPKGLVFAYNRLWVTDIDHVYGYDVATGKRDQVFSLAPRRVQFNQGPVAFLNDIVALPENRLLVSGTDSGRLYRISLSDGAVQSFPVDLLRGPNGLAFDQDVVYAVGFGDSGQSNGPVLKITRQGDSEYRFEQHNSLLGNLDGVAVYQDGLFVSDWSTGSLYRIPLAGGKAVAVMTDLSGPADFLIQDGKLWLPEMTANRVIVKTFP